MSPPEWQETFRRDADLRARGERAALLREHRAGQIHRVTRGIYAPSPAPGLRAHEVDEARYLSVIRAAQLTEAEPVFSHLSAALLWSLPVVGKWPDRVHVSCGFSAGGRSTTRLIRHGVDPGEVLLADGFLLTTLARTVVDVARMSSFRDGVVVADAALHGLEDAAGQVIRAPVDRGELEAELVSAGSGRGVAVARKVLEFADGDSGSPGESCSRVGIHVARLPAPVLQQPFYDWRGLIGFSDFWWPGWSLAGEFDGDSKYTDPQFLRGRSPQRALADEKTREDRLRTRVRGVSRWGWATALSPTKLGAHLRAAGLS